jgi:hypothetical protein
MIADRAARVAAESKLARLLIERDSVQFCLEFLRSLQFNFDSCAEVSGSVVPTGIPSAGPQVHIVNLRGPGPVWRSATATIEFLKPHTDGIRLHLWGGEAKYISLAALPDGNGIGAIWPDQMMPVNAASLAELIAENWVSCICPE